MAARKWLMKLTQASYGKSNKLYHVACVAHKPRAHQLQTRTPSKQSSDELTMMHTLKLPC